MSRPRLLFYIQHLLGIGHLVRGARIAAAAAAERFDVTVVLGGQRPAAISFGRANVVQLRPVKAGPDGFSALIGMDGRPYDHAFQAERRDALLRLLADLRPDVLLIEAYPFGRRAMRFELLPLLEASRARWPRPLVACSIRDILQEQANPARIEETVALVQRFFDRVMVHGDPHLVRLEHSFRAAHRIADRLIYTGIVGPEPDQSPPGPPGSGVIVSVGGGAVGANLIETALAARPLSRLADEPWLVLTGPNFPADACPAPMPGVTIQPFVSDLPERLRGARLSVSQAGYNTAADLLGSPGCRAVLVPYVGRCETEQTRRAILLQEAGLAVAVDAATLTPAGLAAAMDQALDMPQCSIIVDDNGAASTAERLYDVWRAHATGLAEARGSA